MQDEVVLRVADEQLRVVARRGLDVQRDPVRVREQVVGGRRPGAAAERGEPVRDGLRVEDRAQQTWYGTPGAPRSAALTSAFVASATPAEFIPALASSPASTTVT